MSRKLNITIVSTRDSSNGSARAAYRLHKGLRLLEQDSVMLVRHKGLNDDSVKGVMIGRKEETGDPILGFIQQFLIDENRTTHSDTLFTFAFAGYDISKTEIINNSDIINLHWVSRFQSVDTIARLLALGKPVVWTLHDQWPFTGGCHYSAGCEKFVTNCKGCPQLKDDGDELPHRVLQQKINKISHKALTIVTPSAWMADCAKRSRVFGHLRVEVIPNSVETDVFAPLTKERAKKRVGIDSETVTVLFGTNRNNEKRKGYEFLREALAFCRRIDEFNKLVENRKLSMMVFGSESGVLSMHGLPVCSLGYVDSDDRLAEIYSAADNYVLPSAEDNLPNNLLESMACGTPVVSFAVGGMPDLIENGVTGYMAPAYSTERLGELIFDLVCNKAKRRMMSGCCRKLTEERLQLSNQARGYMQLFEDVLRDNGSFGENQGGDEDSDRRRRITANLCEVDLGDGWEGIYRKSAVELMKRKDKEIEKRNEMIKRIYDSATYKAGRALLLPLQTIRRMMTGSDR